jgi:hypothetical protein
LGEEVIVATKDGAKRLKKEAVLVSRAIRLAGEGNVACLKMILQMTAGAQTKLVQEAVISVEEALRYKRRCAETISDCAAEGKTPPEFLPHPDDMVVGIDRVDFLGPMTETQQAAMMLVIKERDEILEVLPEYVRVAPEHEHGGPLYLAYVEAVGALRQCNVSLPPRLRKGLVERPSLLQWRKPATSRRRDAYGGDEQAPT